VSTEEGIANIQTAIGTFGTKIEDLKGKIDVLERNVSASGIKVDELTKRVKDLRRDNWGIPVTVAAITGLLALLGAGGATWYSVRKQLDNEVRAAIGRQTVTSYQNIRETIVDLDLKVQALCQFRQFNQSEELFAFCAKLQNYAENAPITVSEKTRKDIEDYDDYIARHCALLNKAQKDNQAFCREAKTRKIALLKEVDAIVQ
jgi:hypothetical protein